MALAVESKALSTMRILWRAQRCASLAKKDEDCVQVPGHRVVLSAWSSVFCAMLERWVGDRGEHPTILVRSCAQC